MMTLKKKILLHSIIIVGLLVSTNIYAGDPPPVGGDPTGDPSATPIGGSAPIGSGLALVLGLGLAYGAKKTLQLKEEE
jgi:hypothetical protein